MVHFHRLVGSFILLCDCLVEETLQDDEADRILVLCARMRDEVFGRTLLKYGLMVVSFDLIEWLIRQLRTIDVEK